MAEAQAIDRVHRIGQRRDVKVYRYIVNNSIESVSYLIFRAHINYIDEILTELLIVCTVGSAT
jgi:hypothetical protein